MSLINKEIVDFKVQAFVDGEFREITKADVLGKWSVFFFYPADFTFVCPTELEDLADKYADFKNILLSMIMRNIYGVAWNNAGSTFKVENGKYEDDDDRWLEKNIAYVYNYGSRIGDTPLSFNLYNEYGLWEENNIKSWHREHNLSLHHDPIKFRYRR